MKKILLSIILLFDFIFANIEQNDDSKLLNEIGLTNEFLKNPSFASKYKELSTPKKIQYYDNIIRKSSLNSKIVREELEEENLPSFLFFIPLIESSYVNQISKKGPSGLWQIMPLTANNLKLRRDEFVDERLDLIKSTKAATTYLKKYHKKFSKWYLATIAYNAGEGRVIDGIARASLDNYLEQNPNMYHDKVIKLYNLYIHDYRKNKKGIDNLHTIYKDLGLKHGYFDYNYLLKHNNKRDYLPKTSVNYINMLVSFSLLASNNKFKNLERSTKYDLEEVKANRGLKLKTISDALAMDYGEFRNLNKHLLKDIVPTNQKNYNLYIPHTKVELYNSRIANIQGLVSLDDKVTIENIQETKRAKNIEKSVKQQARIVHLVEKGDTLSSISKKYKVNINKIKKDNKKATNKLKIGERIEIY